MTVGFELESVCRAPAIDVFKILHDPSRIPEWWAGVDRVETGPDGTITRYTREWPVERFLRDAKLLDIGAGTNEIRRMLIGRELVGAA